MERTMTRRMIFPLVFGIVGTAILLSLGTWQVFRLQWKTQILHEIATRLASDPVALPENSDPVGDKYLRVMADGVIGAEELHVLAYGNGGPGFKVIAPMALDNGRRVLLDRGFMPETAKNTARTGGVANVVGVLVWPQETDGFVPAPNLDKNIWFARDVELMAKALNTEPVMISVTDSTLTEGITPQAVSVNIANRHLEYVLTWYSMAIIWIGMTVYFLWRIKHGTA